jgi:uncharacterized protein YqcC (DUF446 family)
MWLLISKSKHCAKIRSLSSGELPMKYQQTQAILQAIEAELRRLQLWTELPPSAAALASQAPFCCDTMPLQQWLQYVLLPRMQALIDARLPLPTQISICPIAEEAFTDLGATAWPLINRIADLDELLSGRREQQIARV